MKNKNKGKIGDQVDILVKNLCPQGGWGFGFLRSHYFNIAMLAKTGWNSLTTPEALVSKLFQAQYYHKSNFLDTGLGSNPSFVWRDLCVGKQILK